MAKEIILLSVEPKEQLLGLANGYTADIKFDRFYYRWYYDLYKDNALVYSGISLTPDSNSLANISKTSLGVLDNGDPRVEYEPYNELGVRLLLLETDYED